MLDRAQQWNAMCRLLERVVTSLDEDTFLDDCLDTLVELFDADRGLLLLSDSAGASSVINARAQDRALSASERAEVSRTIIDRAQRSGEIVEWEPDASSAYAESIMTLGILTAIAAPLKSIAWRKGIAPGEDESQLGSFTRGVLYLDFRDCDKTIGDADRELLEAAAALISVVLEQSQRIEIAREHLREARARQGGAVAAPTLDELLRPRSARELRREIESALHSDAPILITGESGTGKTLLANAIANAAGRHPVVRAVLGSSEDLNTISSELFGHEKGAYSGALTKRVGLVEYADGGTLILDEILNLPLHAQQLLLDFTQFGTYRPLGLDRPEPKQAHVRLIACTNGDLEAAVRDGRFREDLYYRLAGVRLEIAPLRQHREEISELAENLIRRADPSRPWRLSLELRRTLASAELEWRGNVRQLEIVMQRARDRALVADAHAEVLAPEHLAARDLGVGVVSVPGAVAPGESSSPLCAGFPIEGGELGASWERLQAERAAIEELERELIARALVHRNGVVAYAARDLGMRRSSLASKIRTLKIDTPSASG